MTTSTFMTVFITNVVAISAEPGWDAPTEFHHVHPGMLDHHAFPHPQHRRRAAELMRVATASVSASATYTSTLSSPQGDKSSSADARGIICERILAAVPLSLRRSWTQSRVNRVYVRIKMVPCQCCSSAHALSHVSQLRTHGRSIGFWCRPEREDRFHGSVCGGGQGPDGPRWGHRSTGTC